MPHKPKKRESAVNRQVATTTRAAVAIDDSVTNVGSMKINLAWAERAQKRPTASKRASRGTGELTTQA